MRFYINSGLILSAGEVMIPGPVFLRFFPAVCYKSIRMNYMNTYETMDVKLSKNESLESHFRVETIVYFVVDGEIKVTIKDSSWNIKKDNFILVNSGLMHSVSSCSENSIMCSVSFSCGIIADMSGEDTNLFYCNSLDAKDKKYHEMRRILHELVYVLVQRPHKTACLKMSILYKLLDCLMEYFRLDMELTDIISADDMKMMQILQYINQNYAYNVSLTELAERMYMSKSTLSRFFTRQTGIHFADYVNQIRLKYAVEDIIYSNKNITKIAMDNGFSNPSAFNKIFREQYGMSPSQYRAQSGQQSGGEVSLPAPDKDLQEEIKEKLSAEENAVPDKVNIKADVTGGRPYPKKWARCINIGSAYNLTIANLQYHTLYLKEHLGISYARVWSVFSQKLTISDGKTPGYYNYDKIDIVFDFLVSNHIHPFIDFGNRPDTATYSPGHPVYCDIEYIQFETKELWQSLFKDFIIHITNRYGEAETSKWIFEFSMDSTHAPERDYYKDGTFDYMEIFLFAYKTIKTYMPDAKVGGPMSEVELDYDLVSGFLKFCRENDCMPDFISFMLFPYHSSGISPDFTTERATTALNEREQVRMMRNLLEENDAQDCLIYISEWNDTLSNRNYLNDSCSRASYIIKKISEIADDVDLISLWMASDWMSSYYDTVCVTNGGSGILTKDTVRKPAYFALDFLGKMGSTLIEKGANYIITRSKNGSYYILCFNYKWFSVNYFVQDEAIRDPEILYDIFEDDYSLDLEFQLDNIPAQREYIIKKRTVNDEYGSILSEWKNFHYDKNLRSSDIKYIRECCIPKVNMERENSGKGVLRVNLTIKPHEITLIHIYEEQ